MPVFFAGIPGLDSMFRQGRSDIEILQMMVFSCSMINALAAYMHRVLAVLYAQPLLNS